MWAHNLHDYMTACKCKRNAGCFVTALPPILTSSAAIVECLSCPSRTRVESEADPTSLVWYCTGIVREYRL